jgi:hypothetical protein
MDNLFTPGLTEPALDPNKDYLQDFVGEGKKYQTVDEAAKALAKKAVHADALIDNLTKKQDELRSDYLRVIEESKARAKLEDLINHMESKRQQPTSDEPKATGDAQLDLTKVEELFTRKFQETENQKRERENYSLVESKLKERYGNNFAEHLKEQIADLGMSQDEVNYMARKNPKVLVKALGLEQKPQQETFFPSQPRSTQRPEGFKAAPDNQKRTWSYYQKMKETDPKSYFSPKTNVQMVNDQLALGEAFNDGDFYRYGR